MKHNIYPSIGTMMLSLYSTKGAYLCSLDSFHNDIKSGRWKDIVLQIRTHTDAPSVTHLKSKLPLYVAAGDCRERRVHQCLTSPTGYAPFDIDHIPVQRAQEIVAACSDHPCIKAAHLSCRGEGVHLFIAMGVVEADAAHYATVYKQRYAAICRWLSNTFDVEVDTQCKDVLRGMYTSYDPDAFCRPDGEVVSFDFNLETVVKTTAKQENKLINRRWIASFLPTHQYEPSLRHDWWLQLGKMLRKKKVSKECLLAYRVAATQILSVKGLIAFDDPLLRSTTEVDKAMLWGYEHAEEGVKAIKVQLAADFIQSKQLRYDIISRKIQQCNQGVWSELQDRDINSLWRECCLATAENITSNMFRGVLMSDCLPAVNPLTEYVLSLPEWDDSQPDYLLQVAGMVHTEVDELFAACFRKWFVAMVAAWFSPDVVNHQVLVLIGEQGIFKTTWLDALMPPQLALYRSKQSGADHLDKDELLRASEYGLINLDEIDRMGERELNALKSLITTTDINVRAAYSYGKERRIRIASYAASGNKNQFLTDSTGNRRWLPFRVLSIDSPYEHPLPHAGMFAQAYYLYQHGFNYWFTLEDIQHITPHVDAFMVESNEEQLIPVYFEPAKSGDAGAVFLTIAELSSKLISFGNLKKPMDIRQLGILMKRMGFTASRRGISKQRGYIVRELDAEVINANRKNFAKK